jgi:hypothetical protein
LRISPETRRISPVHAAFRSAPRQRPLLDHQLPLVIGTTDDAFSTRTENGASVSELLLVSGIPGEGID